MTRFVKNKINVDNVFVTKTTVDMFQKQKNVCAVDLGKAF